MKTHLQRIGNSYGIIIDKSVRRLLRIGPRAILELSTDGSRIVIEQTGKLLDDDEVGRAREILAVEDHPLRGVAPPQTRAGQVPVNRAALDLDSRKVFKELEQRGLDADRLKHLYHLDNPRWVRVMCWMCESGCATNANDDELATLQRMRMCRDELRAGASWTQAIEKSLLAFPKRSLT